MSEQGGDKKEIIERHFHRVFHLWSFPKAALFGQEDVQKARTSVPAGQMGVQNCGVCGLQGTENNTAERRKN